MTEVRAIDLTELYRCFENIREPTPRVKAAKERILEELLRLAESLRTYDLRPHDLAPRDLAELANERRRITDEQIKHMVNRFLGWKLPESFNPDGGISFDRRPYNTHTAHPMKHEPIGTNLFDASQADAMVRYMLEGMPR